MHPLTIFVEKSHLLHAYISMKLSSLAKSAWVHMKRSYWFLFQSNPFSLQLIYFILISFVGFLALKMLKPKNKTSSPKDLDLLFTSVSALTVSSMATVEMEVFSTTQLWVLIVLMLIGSEVFTSMLGLQFMKAKITRERSLDKIVKSNSDIESSNSTNFDGQNSNMHSSSAVIWPESHLIDSENLKHEAIRYLGYVVLSYIVVINSSSFIFLSMYLSLVSEAGEFLRSKGIQISTFSIFTAISSFGNCGFTPVNENMMIFKKNSALLLLIIPQILAGGTLFPSCLRFTVWLLKKITKKEGYNYILQYPSAIRYKHLLPHRQSVYLSLTVLGFIVGQTLLFCCLEWNSEVLQGMNPYQKIVGILFQSVNSRHAGESVVDISSLSSAILVLYTVMMYLPPYTSFLPINDDEKPLLEERRDGKRKKPFENLILSQISYLAVFIVLICITERQAMFIDPLNFTIFNIVFEVISAYGNVGFSLGYSCKRLLNHNKFCKDASYGFAGKWSAEGKLILIFVMIFGRLKKFNMGGGKAWKLC
ncbi:cation transporter HKT1;3-like isoform X1 [Typha latifolia]|uniref:cation transporter HKT1;3-like isoform X1 n=1 Tax=Typha latifolia TaxID=4733 RepID=UPI003C2F9B8B